MFVCVLLAKMLLSMMKYIGADYLYMEQDAVGRVVTKREREWEKSSGNNNNEFSLLIEWRRYIVLDLLELIVRNSKDNSGMHTHGPHSQYLTKNVERINSLVVKWITCRCLVFGRALRGGRGWSECWCWVRSWFVCACWRLFISKILRSTFIEYYRIMILLSMSSRICGSPQLCLSGSPKTYRLS